MKFRLYFDQRSGQTTIGGNEKGAETGFWAKNQRQSTSKRARWGGNRATGARAYELTTVEINYMLLLLFQRKWLTE